MLNYKNIFISISILILSHTSLLAQDGVGVIAVGQAQEEEDKICLVSSESSTIHAKETIEILKNDFLFYKHRFNFQECTLDNQSARYVINLAFKADGAKLLVTTKVINAEKKSLLDQVATINTARLRDDAHTLSNAIYFSITGKNAIFKSKIVFVSDRTSKGKDTNKELYSMDFDGRRVERLTFYNSTVISPAVSPDNSKIIFSVIMDHKEKLSHSMGKLKNIDLKILDLRTKSINSVSDKPGINSGASFTADGKNIFYTMSFSGNADIYEMNLASGATRKITSALSEDVDPSITRDGTLMSFLSNRSGRAHIYTLDPSGTEKNVKRISFVGQFNATPRFSPDGKEIVFVSWVDNSFDLYRIDSTGQNLVRLTKDFGSNEEPAISPDGEFIIFTSQRILSRTQATQDIYIMNREGEIIGQLTQGFGRCFSPRWTN